MSASETKAGDQVARSASNNMAGRLCNAYTGRAKSALRGPAPSAWAERGQLSAWPGQLSAHPDGRPRTADTCLGAQMRSVTSVASSDPRMHDAVMQAGATRTGIVDPNASESELLEQLENAFQKRYTDLAGAEQLSHEMMAVAQARGLAHVEAVSTLLFAYSAPIQDAPQDGLQQLQDVVSVCRQCGDQQNLTRAADLVSMVYESNGDYSLALQYAEIALEGARACGDRIFEGRALSSLSGILTATGDLELAEKKARLAFTVADEIDSDRLRARTLYRIGCIKRRQGDVELAEQTLEQTRVLARKIDSDFSKADALTELGRLYEDQARLEEAEARLVEAMQITNPDAVSVVSPATRVALARVYRRTGRIEKAKRILLQFDAVPGFFDTLPVFVEGSKLLAEIHDELGEDRLAIEQYRRHVQYRERAMEGEAQRAVSRYKVKVKLAAAEREAEAERMRYQELAAMQTQLVEAERRAEVGRLVAGIAHEMNTPLGVAQSNLDLLERAQRRLADALTAPSSRVNTIVSAMEDARATTAKACDRLDELVRNLRRFVRLDESDVQDVDLNECVEAAFSLLPPSLSEGLTLERMLSPLPPIHGWPARINQTLLTLFVNAAEAQAGRGRIRVESRVDEGACCLHVIDDGPGIPLAAQDKLFEAAFDTSGSRARFRIGLAAARSVVVDHGGTIAFDTGAGGTTFTLRFPLSTRCAE